MAMRKRLWIAVIVAVLTVSCTCSWLDFGPDLSQSMRVGRYITVNYPEDWFGSTELDFGLFSPNYMDFDVDDEDIDQPFFLVVPLEQFVGPDWFGEVDDPSELLDEMAYEFDVNFRSTTTVDVGNVRWTKGTFSGPFGELIGTWEGWIAIELLPRGGAVIIA
ncbi:MAG: hypothetical protein PVI78_08330, partial [Anaerolineales bacterium]